MTVIRRLFANETETTIPYQGDVPTVTVAYLEDGVWNISVATVVRMIGGNVIVTHGGPATGVIKIIE